MKVAERFPVKSHTILKDSV